MYEEDRNNRENNSEAGYNDRNDEHMEYRRNAAQNTDSQEVRSQQSPAQEQGRSEAWKGAAQECSQRDSSWQSAPQSTSQSGSGAWQSAAQANGQESGSGAWQSATQANGQESGSSAWQSAAQTGSQESGSSAWQSASQAGTQNSSTWQPGSQEQGQGSAWQSASQNGNQQAAQHEQAHHTTGGWAPRRPEFHHNAHQKPEHAKRSGHGMAKKVAAVTAAAVLFGTVAGGTMFAVDTMGEYLKGQYTTIGQTETQAQVKVAESDSGDGSTTAGAPVTSAIQTDVSSIVEKAMPSVVAINNTMVMQQQTWFGPSQTVEVPSSGSGIIVGQNDEELLIVTNNHVVEDSKELTVTFIDNQQVSAAIKGTDSETDLAVIAIPLKDIPSDTMNQIKVATLGDSDALKVGQGVIAIGNALGYGQSVTVGYVSALNREVKAEDQTTRTLLQTDAAINPGNSGGALLNMRGEVIGINAAKYSSTEVEGMGYAIPVSRVSDIIENLMNEQTRTKVAAEDQGTIGIKCLDVSSQIQQAYNMPAGIYISEVTSGGAAENAGLKSGYVLTSFDGHSITSTSELKSLLQYYSAGETVEVEVQVPDNGSYETKTFSLTLGTSISSSDDQQSDSQQNAGSSRSAEGGNTLTSATPSI